MNTKKVELVVGGVLAIVAAAVLMWVLLGISDDNTANIDQDVNNTDTAAVDVRQEGSAVDSVSEPASETINYTHEGDLLDVTEGEFIQGISTAGNGSGVAKAVFGNGTFMMSAEFSNLPDPINGYFYEGWLVSPSSGNFFSTGVVEKDNSGNYIDTYTDSTDYTSSHNKYVLTLEPDDDDPAPADHIVEGSMKAL